MRTSRESEMFPTMTPKQMQWLSQYGDVVSLKAGDVVFAEGTEAECLYVVLEGAIRITRQAGAEEMSLTVYHEGQFSGELAVLTGGLHIATGRAVRDSQVRCIGRDLFIDLLMACPEMREIMLPAMVQRRQEADGRLQQRDKMAALGKLSAGLAHELNNPAAASLSAAQQLRETLQSRQTLSFKLNAGCLTAKQSAFLADFAARLAERSEPPPLDPLAQSDREEEIGDWLDHHGIDDGWQLASTFVSAGLDTTQLDSLAENLPAEALGAALAWLEAALSTVELLDTVEKSTARISELVKAIKAYTYMDQGGLLEVDVHDGLESTLTILCQKLKRSGVELVRDYDRSLPTVCAYGSQLNQVWTNLIDNALDALAAQEGPKRLCIRTCLENDCVLVEFADNGPGIPPEIRSRIFDPFFTTKDVGKGTGLGLDIAYRIVVREHHGDLSVESEPGSTRFMVRLPLRQPEGKGK